MKIDIKTLHGNGGKVLLTITLGKVRSRKRHASRADADREIAEVNAQAETVLAMLLILPRSKRAASCAEVLECFEQGISVREVLSQRNSLKAKIGNSTTLKRLVDEAVESAKFKNTTQAHQNNLSNVLNKFIAGREDLPIRSVTLDMIEGWLAAQKGHDGKTKASPTSLRGYRALLSCMFSEAIRRQYIGEHENPMKRVLSPRIVPKKPDFFTVGEVGTPQDEVGNLFWVCRQTDPGFIPWLTISLFAGCRPEEMEKLKWSDIDMEQKQIIIDESTSKVRMRRIIDMEPVLVAWLKHFLATTTSNPIPEYIVPAPIDRRSSTLKPYQLTSALKRVSQLVRRHREKLALRSGVRWTQDKARKTAATYMMAKMENEHKVAMILGNSPKILFRYYRGLTRRADADRFWAKTPDAVKNDLIELPKGGIQKDENAKNGYSYKTRPGKLIP